MEVEFIRIKIDKERSIDLTEQQARELCSRLGMLLGGHGAITVQSGHLLDCVSGDVLARKVSSPRWKNGVITAMKEAKRNNSL